RVVAAPGEPGRTEAHAAGQDVLDDDAGGVVGPVVGQGDGVGDGVADVGRRVADRLADLQVGLLGRLGDGGAVVGGVGVELVAVVDAGPGELRGGADPPRLELQGGLAPAGQRAHVPQPGGAGVGPLAGGRG